MDQPHPTTSKRKKTSFPVGSVCRAGDCLAERAALAEGGGLDCRGEVGRRRPEERSAAEGEMGMALVVPSKRLLGEGAPSFKILVLGPEETYLRWLGMALRDSQVRNAH